MAINFKKQYSVTWPTLTSETYTYGPSLVTMLRFVVLFQSWGWLGIHVFKWKGAGRHFGALWDKDWRISYHAARTERLCHDEQHVISRVLGNCTYRLNIIHAGCMHVPRRIISFHVIWFTFLLAPRSPYLRVCELFLWGFLRKWVYANKPGRESWRY